jgi:uncharacterized OB-fold protein
METKPSGGVAAAYQAALNGGRFVIPRCNDCGKHVFYPREVCPHCQGVSFALDDTTGNGTVYSTTTVRRKPEAGGDYNVALIDLNEGVRMMSRVDGITPDEVKIGMSVRAKVIDNNGSGLVVFEKVGEAK